MKLHTILFYGIVFYHLVLLAPSRIACATSNTKTYIAYLGRSNLPSNVEHHAAHHEHTVNTHRQLISSFMRRNTSIDDRLIYSYTKVFNGFAATLHDEEATDLAKHPDVISVFENRRYQLSTTRSWKFLGLEKQDGVVPDDSLWKKAKFGEDIIIGIIDSGIRVDAESFNDEGYGPIPSRFKGKCENEEDPSYKCNKKLIGARYLYKGAMKELKQAGVELNESSRREVFCIKDKDGHGSHCGSIVAGNVVKGAAQKPPAEEAQFSIGKGFAYGTAKGGSPRARLASYKVSYDYDGNHMCFGVDVLAGIEAALTDGVDIITMSLDVAADDAINNHLNNFFFDGISVASFHGVVHKGVPIVVSAGNSGPSPSTTRAVDPWIFTVAASSIGRELFTTLVTLGDHKTLLGKCVLSPPMNTNQMFPLITGTDAAITNGPNANVTAASYCSEGSVDPVKVKGKILVCKRGDMGSMEDKARIASEAGAVGIIIVNILPEVEYIKLGRVPSPPISYPIPAAHLNYTDAQMLLDYINSTRSPVASLNTETTDLPAPMMGNFSSRGPTLWLPEILKPDITAPGVNILGVYTNSNFNASPPWLIASGTSQSAPHVAGVIGLLRVLYPHWSPSALKSAIMTTASILDKRLQPILDHDKKEATPFAYGAGHIQPNEAMDPGLVYDMGEKDYLDFLCARGVEPSKISKFTTQPNQPYSCPSPNSIVENLNYPTITLVNFTGKFTVTRRLKNVGTPATYTAKVVAPLGITITVNPNTLTFNKVDQELEFKLTFESNSTHLPQLIATDYVFGRLIWSDGKHNVQSIISIKPKP